MRGRLVQEVPGGAVAVPVHPIRSRVRFGAISLAAISMTFVACAPKIELAIPSEPIVINMNIKIEHEVRVKVDDDLEALFEEDEEIF
jgi:hypothetical protein